MPGSCDPGNVSFLGLGESGSECLGWLLWKGRVFRAPGLPPLLASLGPQQGAASLSGGIPEKERILGEVVVSVFLLATMPGLLDSNIDKVTLVLALTSGYSAVGPAVSKSRSSSREACCWRVQIVLICREGRWCLGNRTTCKDAQGFSPRPLPRQGST